MRTLQQNFSVAYQYAVLFTNRIFHPDNPDFYQLILQKAGSGRKKLLFIIDSGVDAEFPTLTKDIKTYTTIHKDLFELVCHPLVIPGGEEAKNDPEYLETILQAINNYNICRHSFVVAIGGGAILDLVGFAAATAHRGIRHIRIPTTVLAQNDSGVGVKNGINAFGKKNFLGSFAPPFAVFNDYNFLLTLSERDWRSGISEAIKVALIKDADFFDFIAANSSNLIWREKPAMQELIYRCAQLHLNHIANGDPFEFGSSRPLDFGHWAAHKIEQITDYSIRHGEAVAIGIALDTTYAYLSGLLPKADWSRIIDLIKEFGFDLHVPEMSLFIDEANHSQSLLQGLSEFREHLGGQLTIMLLSKIGKGIEVNKMNLNLIKRAVKILQDCHETRLVVT
jgi:3-dehydroquinate synthase